MKNKTQEAPKILFVSKFLTRAINTYKYVYGLIWTFPASLVDSILFASDTFLPNKQYLGIKVPTTPATTEPEWIPTRI